MFVNVALKRFDRDALGVVPCLIIIILIIMMIIKKQSCFVARYTCLW